MLKKRQEHSFVSDNTRKAISENWSAQLDKSDSIKRDKLLETTYKKYLKLLHHLFNVKYENLIATRKQISTSWGCAVTTTLSSAVSSLA